MSERVVVVTGTSSGIGAALATELLRREWTVIGIARREAALDSPRYRHLQVDLGDSARLAAVADAELAPLLHDARWSRVGLVNNAAIIGALRGLEDITPRQFSRVLAVNTVAPVYLMGFVARVAAPAKPLRIVNISTGAAVHAFPGLGDYGASKAALRMAGMVLAAELSSDQRPGGRHPDAALLSYEPGVVETDMQVEARTRSADEFPWNQPFRDFATQGLLEQPADVVGEVADFLSGAASEPFVERRFGDD